jgi:hypothetical protein
MSSIKFSVNDGDAGWALGSIDGIAAELETTNYIDDITRDVSEYAEREIERQIDALANAGGDLEHVYEFRKSGPFNRADRLFNVFSTGGRSRRTISFTFIPSVRGGPSLKDRIDRGQLAIKSSDKVFSPGKRSGNKVSLTKRYTFRNKAALLEFGGQINVLPQNKKIFVPFSSNYSGDRPYAFLSGASIDLSRTRHKGKFSAAWLIATASAAEKSTAYVEKRFAEDVERVNIRRGAKSSRKGFNIAFKEAKADAMRKMGV